MELHAEHGKRVFPDTWDGCEWAHARGNLSDLQDADPPPIHPPLEIKQMGTERTFGVPSQAVTFKMSRGLVKMILSTGAFNV